MFLKGESQNIFFSDIFLLDSLHLILVAHRNAGKMKKRSGRNGAKSRSGNR
jgi:hypothetical protein